MADDFIKVLDKRYEAAKAARDQIRPLLEELGKYVWPAMQDMILEVDIPDEGQVRTVDVYNSTAMKAATKMTSGIFSYLMPVGSKWFVFEAEDLNDNLDPDNKLWLSAATVETHKVIWRSNYLREMWTTIKSLVAFGNSCISYDKKKEFKMHPISTFFFEENSSGFVDTVFKAYFYNKRQALQEFENPGNAVMKEEDGSSKMFEFVHCVFPNTDYDEKLGSKKFVSIYFQKDDLTEVFPKGMTKRGGFSEQIYNVARMPKGPTGIHGEATGKDLLPDIKMLNAASEALITGVEFTANPTTVLQDDGVTGQPVTGPGGLITIRAGAEKPYLMSPGVDINSLAAYVVSLEEAVRDGFHNKIFTPLDGVKNISSATESTQRVDENITLAAPLITPLNHEVLDPMFLQVLATIPEDRLPPKPDGLQIKIVYQGRLALAMGKLQAQAGERWMAKWSPLEELRPVLDNVDVDGLARESAINEGVAAEYIIPVEIRDANRKQIAQQQQIAQTVGIAETASKAYKNVQGVENV